jgi:zinc transport system substrate-binding protein
MRKFLFFIPILALFCASCQKKEKTCYDVLVSIPPYAYFVNELSDSELKTTSIVPEGSSPHFYEPSPKEVLEISTAKAWICIGESFEGKINASLKEKNPNLVTIDLSKELPIHKKGTCSCCHHSLDLHFWMSLKLAKIQAELIAKTLINAFPERSDQITQNLPKLLDKLSAIDEQITQKLALHAEESLLVSHPAFAYFCEDYKLKQLSIEQEGKDPLPQQISQLLQIARSSSIRAIFTQAQYSNKGAMRIAEELGIKTHEVDPYSANYPESLLQITHFITGN